MIVHLIRMMFQKVTDRTECIVRLLAAIICAVAGYLLRTAPPTTEAEEEFREHMSTW
jgi:hypothetical protein